MKLYLAASYTRRLELLAYAMELTFDGHQIVSTWVDGHHETRPNIDTNGTQSEQAGWAVEDMAELNKAEAVILFTDALQGRGGKDFEAGYAVGRGLPLYICGPRSNVFYAGKEHTQADTWREMRRLLGKGPAA